MASIEVNKTGAAFWLEIAMRERVKYQKKAGLSDFARKATLDAIDVVIDQLEAAANGDGEGVKL